MRVRPRLQVLLLRGQVRRRQVRQGGRGVRMRPSLQVRGGVLLRLRLRVRPCLLHEGRVIVVHRSSSKRLEVKLPPC